MPSAAVCVRGAPFTWNEGRDSLELDSPKVASDKMKVQHPSSVTVLSLLSVYYHILIMTLKFP